MKARYIQEVGTRGQLRIYWDRELVESLEACSECPQGHPNTKYLSNCPNSYGKGKPGIHNAYAPLGTVTDMEAWDAFGRVEDYTHDRWPTQCASCGAPVPATDLIPEVGKEYFRLHRQVSTERFYNTPSGKPEPGDIYLLPWHEPDHCPYWSNCDGNHMYGILPNGWDWDMTSRASNCDLKDNKTHRCWVIHGSAEDGTITVDKNGDTCSAGAGSIAAPGWHGFLRNGEFVT